MTFGTASQPQTPRRRWRRWFVLLLLLGLGGFIWFLPTLASTVPIRTALLDTVANRFGGRIDSESISLGWLSPVEVRQLQAWDADGNLLVSVGRLSTEQSLFGLLTAGSTPRKIRLEQPQLNVIWDGTTSNWEQTWAKWVTSEPEPTERPSSASSGSASGVELELVEATVSVLDRQTGQAWEIAQLDAKLLHCNDSSGELSGQFRGMLWEAGQLTGDLSGELAWRGEEGAAEASPGTTWGNGQARVNLRSLPIAIASPMLRRVSPSLWLAGRFTGTAQFSWSAGGEQLLIEQAVLQGFECTAPELLGSDRLVIQQLQAGGQIRREGNRWELAQVALTSELFSVHVAGAGNLATEPSADPQERFQAMLLQGGYQVAAQVDLARLAQQLPTTLHIRPGTQIREGRLTVQLDAIAGPNRQWNVRAGTENLVGLHEGREIRMVEPLQAELIARLAQDQWVIDNVACRASFLQLQGQGTLVQGRLAANADLSKLAAELQRFVDLGGVDLGGQITGQLDWRQSAPGSLTLDGILQADQFVLQTPNRLPWNEPRLTLQFHGSGTTELNRLKQLESGKLELTSGGDRLQADLLAPWAPSTASGPLAVKAFMTGDLATWAPRLERFVSLPASTQWQGQIQGSAELVGGSSRWELTRCDGEARGVRITGPGWGWQEPIIKLAGSGVWSPAEQLWTTQQMTVSSSSLSFQAVALQVRAAPATWQATGEVNFRGDLARVSGVLPMLEDSPGFRLAGDAVGTLRLQPDSAGTLLAVQTDIKDFRYDLPAGEGTAVVPVAFQPPSGVTRSGATQAGLTGPTTTAQVANVHTEVLPSWKPVWQESLLKFATEARYEPTSQTLAVSKIEVAGSSLSLGARGQVERLDGPCWVQLEGQISYDLDGVSTRLRPWLTDQVRFRGRETRPFRYQGPLLAAPDELSISANPAGASSDTTTPVATADATLKSHWAEIRGATQLAWESAEIAGFRLGAGQLDAELKEGIVEIQPVNLPLNDGRLRLVPRIVLDHEPAVLQLARGPLLEQVRVSPDMCRSWLKYVAPLVADTTEAEGLLSVDLVGATVPLNQPQDGDVQGTLKIHSVRLGPGPLSRSLIQLAEQVRAISQQRPWNPNASKTTWLELPAQSVAFRMAEQRIHHQGLLFQIDDVQVRTSGSVGLDQQLALEAEVPIRDEWVSQSPLLANLKGQTLKIPIRGTLSQPRLDERALANLTRQAVGGAVNRALENQINRGLDKLFGPARP